MGILAWIKQSSRRVSDTCAGKPAYFELATTNLSLYRALKAAAQTYGNGRLLDAGAGRMAYRPILEKFADTYESLDLSEHEGIDHVADLQHTGLADALYDTIFCAQVIHHLPDPRQALGEIARLLKPGGHAIISVPHLAWLHNEPHDYYRFTPHSLRHLLKQAGLHEIRIEPIGGLVCFLAYAPSTFALALLQPVRPLFALGLLVNRLFIRCALLLDALLGIKSLYPTNYLAIAQKPA